MTLREDLAAGIGADAARSTSRARSLVAIHDWTFLFGPGFCVGVNGILLGYLFFRTGLMPPRLAMLGVIGGPLIFASAIAVLFGAYEQDGLHFLFSIPESAFEAAITIYMISRASGPRRSSPAHQLHSARPATGLCRRPRGPPTCCGSRRSCPARTDTT